MIEVELRYTGNLADLNRLDFYDASRALAGFQRSLAIVTHLALNGEVITHAPALRGAQIITEAPSEGSFRSKAWIVIGGVFAVGSVGKDSPVGQVVTSLYDYVLSETMGFHPDYGKTLQAQYAEHLAAKKITPEKIDSAVEKAESGIANMHRPIFASKTATMADIHSKPERGPSRKLGPDMSMLTHEYIAHTTRAPDPNTIVGVISSYNINTFKGRIYSQEHQRPIAFELVPSAQQARIINLITRSLRLNAADRNDRRALIQMEAHRLESSTGRLKALQVVNVSPPADDGLLL